MIVTLSERRLTALVQQLENIDDSPEEILVRFDHYCSRLFVHIRDAYGIKMLGMTSQSGTVASFSFDISGTRNHESDECWDRLLPGLAFLNPVAVSVEQNDMRTVCTGLVAAAMIERWNEYGGALQRLSVAEIRPTIEAWLQQIVWSAPINTRPDYRGLAADETGNSILAEIQFQNALLAEGIEDPLKHQHAIDEYEFNQEQAARKAANERELANRWR